jgi:3-hydroxyisobutyrate dehydrogenase
MMRTGFIGLGSLGKAMARRLVAEGTQLVVWNRTPEKALDLDSETVEFPSQVLEKTDIVLLNLFDSEAVREVLTDSDGLLEGEMRGKIIVDTSTNHPEAVLEFYRMVEDKGGVYLEAPVLGSVVPATQGGLTLLVGVDKKAAEKALPLFETLARTIFYFDERGQATKMKLVNNLVLGAFMATLAEAEVLGEAVGLPRAKVLDILAAGAGNSALLNAKKGKLLREDFSPHFATATIYKDLLYLEELARSLGRPLLTGASARELFGRAVARGEGDLDFSAVYRVITEG